MSPFLGQLNFTWHSQGNDNTEQVKLHGQCLTRFPPVFITLGHRDACRHITSCRETGAVIFLEGNSNVQLFIKFSSTECGGSAVGNQHHHWDFAVAQQVEGVSQAPARAANPAAHITSLHLASVAPRYTGQCSLPSAGYTLVLHRNGSLHLCSLVSSAVWLSIS